MHAIFAVIPILAFQFDECRYSAPREATVDAAEAVQLLVEAGAGNLKIEGKLVQFNFRNPHSFVTVDTVSKDGKTERWVVEWGGATSLGGQGVTRTTLQIGDEVVITGNPSRTAGLSRLKMNTLHRKSDGFGWGTRPGEVVD